MSRLTAAFEARLGGFALDVAFAAPVDGITALFGHSGSGKTTVLRCIAGLERSRGQLSLDGEIWQESASGRFVPTHRRPLGYVFQEASLFPHLSVRANLEYGWKRVPAGERRIAFDEAVDLLGIAPLLDRRPARLSGGERQRVGIARALLTSPRLLLMDEPLSALDERSKQEILPFLERLRDELAIPILYVSHSIKEVARLADWIVWLGGGRLLASGPAGELLPQLDAELSEEAGAVIETVVAVHDEHHYLTGLDSVWGRFWVRKLPHPVGRRVRVRLPARDISLSLERERASSILNVLPGVIEAIDQNEPGRVLVRLRPVAGEGPSVTARVTTRSCEELGLAPGMQVFGRIKSVGLME